jgi:hypothetical protein
MMWLSEIPYSPIVLCNCSISANDLAAARFIALEPSGRANFNCRRTNYPPNAQTKRRRESLRVSVFHGVVQHGPQPLF